MGAEETVEIRFGSSLLHMFPFLRGKDASESLDCEDVGFDCYFRRPLRDGGMPVEQPQNRCGRSVGLNLIFESAQFGSYPLLGEYSA